MKDDPDPVTLEAAQEGLTRAAGCRGGAPLVTRPPDLHELQNSF